MGFTILTRWTASHNSHRSAKTFDGRLQTTLGHRASAVRGTWVAACTVALTLIKLSVFIFLFFSLVLTASLSLFT